MIIPCLKLCKIITVENFCTYGYYKKHQYCVRYRYSSQKYPLPVSYRYFLNIRRMVHDLWYSESRRISIFFIKYKSLHRHIHVYACVAVCVYMLNRNWYERHICATRKFYGELRGTPFFPDVASPFSAKLCDLSLGRWKIAGGRTARN